MKPTVTMKIEETILQNINYNLRAKYKFTIKFKVREKKKVKIFDDAWTPPSL